MAGGRDICGDSHSCLPDMTTCLHYDIIQIQKQKKMHETEHLVESELLLFLLNVWVSGGRVSHDHRHCGQKTRKGYKKKNKTTTQNCLMEKWIFLIFIMPKNLYNFKITITFMYEIICHWLGNDLFKSLASQLCIFKNSWIYAKI